MTSVKADPLHSTANRLGTIALSLLIGLQTLTGCAELSPEQKGAATGAGIGTAVGAVAGALADKKNPGQGAVIGATAGAIVGGVAGWAVGAYRVKQLKPREEAAAANNYTPQQGVVTKIDRTAAMPQQLKLGDQLTVQSQYTVLAPPQNNQVRVREARTVYFNDQPLTDLPTRELVLGQGTNEDQQRNDTVRLAGEVPGVTEVKQRINVQQSWNSR